VEARNLWRNLAAHLPLRLPAQLILGIFFGWIAPNLGQDALLNARDLMGMGALIYFILWQVQLLTNRLGSEAGTAALLFGFPFDRTLMLLIRNVTLLAVLLPLDGALVSGIVLQLHAGQLLLPGIGITAIVLLLLTTIGNLVSVLYPYPIARRREGFFAEPDRSLIFLFAVIGAAIAGVFWCVNLLSEPVRPWFLLLFTGAVYGISLRFCGTLLARQEQAIIARLDGGVS
jgi:hypothetical protein